MGRSVIDPQIVELVQAQRKGLANSPVSNLSGRELEVLREMARGRTNAGIAAVLTLSQSAVEKLVNGIFSELGLSEETLLHRRVAAVMAYLRDAP